jgi:hypothetical protein
MVGMVAQNGVSVQWEYRSIQAYVPESILFARFAHGATRSTAYKQRALMVVTECFRPAGGAPRENVAVTASLSVLPDLYCFPPSIRCTLSASPAPGGVTVACGAETAFLSGSAYLSFVEHAK